MSRSIDRKSFEPPYAQLARGIRGRIASGEYRPGDRLPSEAELCATYGVSRMTVRRAFQELTREDVIEAEHGRGTFVKLPQLGAATFDLAELRRYLADPGIEAQIVEAHTISPPPPRVCRKLSVDTNGRVVSIKRLLRRGNEVLFYHTEYLVFDPARPLVEAELSVTALQGLFSGIAGADIKYGRLTLHASTLTEEEAAYLNERPGTTAWVLEHLFYDFANHPESWGRFISRADRLNFSTTVGIVGDDAEGR
jgi:DNA-binding GntR family transcriptional regulator